MADGRKAPAARQTKEGLKVLGQIGMTSSKPGNWVCHSFLRKSDCIDFGIETDLVCPPPVSALGIRKSIRLVGP